MKLAIVLYSNEPETVWNAFRLATFSCKQGDTVSAFLLGMGVEAKTLDSKNLMLLDKFIAL